MAKKYFIVSQMPSVVESGTDVGEGGETLFHPTLEAYHLKYEEELKQLFEWTESGTERIAQLAVTGQLEKSRFRSVIWQILLGVLPYQSCLWVQRLRQLRNQYRSKRDLLLVNPHISTEDDHPLSQEDSSAWHQYYCDKELQGTIRKDVVRTSPGDTFFSSESIQSIMVNILFLYAQEHEQICYRQGMHEVLAPILQVLHADQQALLEAQKVMPVQGNILEVLDYTCLEEDAYCLLESIMKHLACTYSTPDVTPSSTGVFPCLNARPVELESEVCSRMRRIRDEILDVWDPELRQHLVDLDVPLYFGIRWLRVMFGLEFSKENLFLLWDTIFGANEQFALVDYIVVAMLMVIRSRLLEEDFTGCLELLVHYPADNQARLIFRLALHMFKPKYFTQPEDIFDTEKPVVETGSSSLSRRLRQLVSRSRKPDFMYSPANLSSRNSNAGYSTLPVGTRGSRFEQGDSYLHNFPRNPVRNSSQDAVDLASLQSKVLLTSLRLAKYQVTIEHHLSSSGAPTSVLNAVQGVKEIAEMLSELGPPHMQVETAMEATQSPTVSAPSSPELDTSPAAQPAPVRPPPGPPANPNKTPILPSANKAVRMMDTEMKIVELRQKATSPRDLVLSNPLRNMHGSANFEPTRDTQLHCVYRRLLGEAKIFARIKQ